MRVVAVCPGSALTASRRLFDALELIFPVRFEPWREAVPCDALLVADADRAAPETPVNVPVLLMAGMAGPLHSQPVRIASESAVDRRLHNVELSCAVVGPELALDSDAKVLAKGPAGVVWTRSGIVDRVRTCLPVLPDAEVLRFIIYTDHGLALISIVELLRRLTADEGHSPPPLRATMLFDDPNLRWRSYGHISYADLVRHADEHGYHATMAMIPLDAWGNHRSAVALFRDRPDRLSLAVHGNDHLKRELFDQHDPAAAIALGAQALRRVARFEANSGLRVGRVMVPPHGMCSQTMACALARLPFDALCSIHPFPWTGSPPADELLAGWGPATFPEGCAVIPRLEFHHSETTIALRAYMDHPIVLYGHHDDVAGGLDVLAEAAERVNRLGRVEWTSLEEIALGNVAVRRDGDALSVRPYANRVCVLEPASTITVHAPGPDFSGWSLESASEVYEFGAHVEVGDGPLKVRLHRRDEVDPAHVPAPRRRVWPHLRRFATESRDRLAPIRRVG